MKDLIKRQEIKRIIDSVKNPFKYENTLTYNPYEVAEKMIEELLKETAEYVCDKMIGERKKLSDEDMNGVEILKDVSETISYNKRIEEEKEIKQQILKEIN